MIGIGGLIDPSALGVGYETIADLLQGKFVGSTLLVLMLVKGFIWAVSLGSGTSGGVLAPLLILGGSLGALEAGFLPAATRIVAIGQHGGGARRNHALPVYSGHLCARAYPRG